MQDIDEHSITAAVVAQHANAADPRLKRIMTSLVEHLHAFVRDVELTEREWQRAIEFLTAVGDMTDAKRQEFILLSDTLGISMLVTAMNNVRAPGCTEATVFGPFHVDGVPEIQSGEDIANGAIGEPCFISGRILALDGAVVAGARIEVWQADAEGFYDVQRSNLIGHQARGTLTSDALGHYRFRSILAEAYPIPHDGPVGKMLDALGRHPWRPAHLHFMITHPDFRSLTTHVFRAEDQYLDSDAVFGVRRSLIAPWIHHAAGEITPEGSASETAFYTLDFDFILDRKPTADCEAD